MARSVVRAADAGELHARTTLYLHEGSLAMPSLSPSFAQHRVFPSHPRLDRYYPAAATEAARRRVGQCLLRGDGPVLVLGAPGVGKTMLVEAVASDVSARLAVVRLAGSQLCTRRALLQAVLHALGGPYKNREEGELRIALADLLADRSKTGDGVALLVDEAQSLPVRLLEELRRLTDVVVEGSPRVRLVLAGAQSLDETFTLPELEPFSQRLAARCYLEPLSRAETADYVRAHLGAAGLDPDRVLAHDAYDAISLASDGLPRLVNQVVDRALSLAAERGATTLNRASIGEAWSDLHQLAAPWQAPEKGRVAAATAPESEIEYGLLEDDEHDDLLSPARDLALQNEAAAVLALGEAVGVGVADWRAVPAAPLRVTAVGPAVLTDEEDELVSYAFPTILREEGLGEAPIAAATVTARGAANPFAEDFDEEEVVLDPFAVLERVIPAAPVVNVAVPNEIARAFAAALVEAEPTPVVAAVPAAVAASQPAQAAESPLFSDADILVVETDDSTVVEAPVRRVEYAELFANLRHG